MYREVKRAQRKHKPNVHVHGIQRRDVAAGTLQRERDKGQHRLAILCNRNKCDIRTLNRYKLHEETSPKHYVEDTAMEASAGKEQAQNTGTGEDD